MEVNKDEALRCIQIAEQCIEEGNKEKASKFLQKAEKLYSTAKAQKLLEQLCKMNSGDSNFSSETRKRSNVSKDNSKKKDLPDNSSNTDYTPEQLKHVQRVKKCKRNDYYEILSVTKEATDSEVKKSYKKLALLLHPDKNKAPGAVEAFKTVGNAAAILMDVEKRKEYDLYGTSDERKYSHQNHHTHHYSEARGFEADMTAEELFNMFFGTAFPSHQSNIFMRRNGRWHRTNEEEAATQTQQNGASAFIQLLPILLLIALSMLSGLFISDPVFSLQPNSKYPVTRHTTRLNVPYYVKENFRLDYQGSLVRLEANIEEEYVNTLRHNCYKEKNHKDAMIWRAQTIGDNDLFTKAKNLGTPSCDEFLKIAKLY